MSRKSDRLLRKLEQSPSSEFRSIQKKFFPELMSMFSGTKDPRHPAYITYSPKALLGQLFYKGICGISSMREMTDSFNTPNRTENIYRFIGEEGREFLPHGVTVNDYLERLSPEELEKILKAVVTKMLRRRSFEDARFRKKWLVIIDATETYSGRRRINEECMSRCHNKGMEREMTEYHIGVLDAKLYLGNGILISIGREFIINEDLAGAGKGTATKQDCELRAFYRLSEKLKKNFPRLPICILADSLYAAEPFMDTCEGNGWDYIIRFKDGSIPSLAEEYEAIPEKERAGNAEYINDIDYNGRKISFLKYRETRVQKQETVTTVFQFLTNIRLTKTNAEKTAGTGRLRWKVENEGFNRQKNWCGDITHMCSWNMNAIKNHYLMQQISDFFRQLYEYYYLAKHGIHKTHKNISSDFLQSLDKQPENAEDISAEIKPVFC